MFKRIFDALKIDFLGSVLVKAYDIGDATKIDSNRKKISSLSKMVLRN
jgi:hypothetical protein